MASLDGLAIWENGRLWEGLQAASEQVRRMNHDGISDEHIYAVTANFNDDLGWEIRIVWSGDLRGRTGE